MSLARMYEGDQAIADLWLVKALVNESSQPGHT